MQNLNLDEIAGFNASNWRTLVRMGGIRYRIRTEGVVAIRLALKILRMSEAKLPLFALRGEIGTVRKTQCKVALTHLIASTPNPKLKLIAIWLRGQCGGYVGKQVLAKLSIDDSEAVRIKVAQALHRMSCWSVLKQMSVNDPSPRVRRVASSREPREYRSRLSQFLVNAHPVPGNFKDKLLVRELHIAKDFEMTPPKEAKSVEFIRSVLERIRLLVRGRIEVG